jgi:hypothetical protein
MLRPTWVLIENRDFFRFAPTPNDPPLAADEGDNDEEAEPGEDPKAVDLSAESPPGEDIDMGDDMVEVGDSVNIQFMGSFPVVVKIDGLAPDEMLMGECV